MDDVATQIIDAPSRTITIDPDAVNATFGEIDRRLKAATPYVTEARERFGMAGIDAKLLLLYTLSATDEGVVSLAIRRLTQDEPAVMAYLVEVLTILGYASALADAQAAK